jgi:hypothetical protein
MAFYIIDNPPLGFMSADSVNLDSCIFVNAVMASRVRHHGVMREKEIRVFLRMSFDGKSSPKN